MWNIVPAFRIILPLVAGILSSLLLEINFYLAILLFALSFLHFSWFNFSRKLAISYKKRYLRGFSTQIAFFFSGILLVQLHDPENYKVYYGNILEENSIAKARITAIPEYRLKTIKLSVEIERIYNGVSETGCFGKAIIYVKNDSVLNQEFQYGEIIILKNEFRRPDLPKNPHEFNYRRYLETQGVLFTSFIQPNEYVKTGEINAKWQWRIIFGSRIYFENLLKRYLPDGDIEGVASALLLGARSSISDEVRDAFANTGTMHILAVSGLHVGILYFIIEWLFNIIPYFNSNKRNAKAYKYGFILIIIWFYAAITGLSPSVSRSAIMFTFLIVGKLYLQKINSFNILAASAIPLLIINPYMITQVGFQLSYLAIFGILTFQPAISNLLHPRNPISKYIWSMLTVSIGAQLGTVPITIYYFHQFPNYFLLSNVLAIPISFVILVTGLVFFVFSPFHLISVYTGKILAVTISALNSSVSIVDSIPGALTDNLSLNTYEMLFMSLSFILAGWFILSKDKRFLFYTLLSVSFLFTCMGLRKLYDTNQESTIFYSLNKGSAICIQYGGRAMIFSEKLMNDTSEDFNFHIRPDLVSKHISKFEFYNIYDSSLQVINIEDGLNLVNLNNKSICIIDSVYHDIQLNEIPTDIVYIINNPFINMENLYENFGNAIFVFDETNNSKSRNFWRKDFVRQNVIFKDLSKEYLKIE